ncbi:hypothetical protein [Acinetobacter calcoaceticus]|uniref:hypothetical protein n=1 Tax=Acinetobacter calcoaceticus TaxID=471 RepID=UPI0018DB33EC|nr:hypothetical protein [Acinetobacter calcoaceticus]
MKKILILLLTCLLLSNAAYAISENEALHAHFTYTQNEKYCTELRRYAFTFMHVRQDNIPLDDLLGYIEVEKSFYNKKEANRIAKLAYEWPIPETYDENELPPILKFGDSIENTCLGKETTNEEE